MLGVLGGGQLGAMFAAAARRLGYQVCVWDPDPEAPAHRLATTSYAESFSDPSTATAFSAAVQAVTYEWENVPASLCEMLERERPVRPSGAILRVIQDRLRQKDFLASRGFPVPPFLPVSEPDRLRDAVTKVGLPAVCKTATTGYDGKGQWRIRRTEDVPLVVEQLERMKKPGTRWIVEQWLTFEREVSVLVVRGADGDVRLYPVVENQHHAGILRMTVVPAEVTEGHADAAANLARRAVEQLEGVGVFCVELFAKPGGELAINEIAPRPHNSGHYTLDACTVSQFEQQVRALCGLPLGEVRLLSPAAMVNLIGPDVEAVVGPGGSREWLAVPGAALHLYGKRTVRPNRKMGHVTFLAERREVAVERAARLRAHLERT